MFNFNVNAVNESGQADDPYGLAWATDPVDGDPYFNFDWQGTGVAINPFGDSDLNTLLRELHAMKNTAGALDNLPDMIATLIQIGKNPTLANNPATQAFFGADGQMFSQLIDAELLLVYSQNVHGDYAGAPNPGTFNPANGETAMAAFANSLLNGPLKGVSASDPVLGPLVTELNGDITPAAFNQLRHEFWGANPDGTGWTYFQIPTGPGQPSQDGHSIDLETLPDGSQGYQSIFARYISSDVLYGGTFGDSTYANAANDLFLSMFTALLASSKNPFYLFMAAMSMFGLGMDNNYQDEMQGYSYTSDWMSKHQDQLQQIVNEFNTPNYFTGTDGAKNAQNWMQQVRELFMDTEFNPYAGSLQGNVLTSMQQIFGTNDPTTIPTPPVTTPAPTPISSYFWSDTGTPNPTQLATALNLLANGGSFTPSGGTAKTVQPDTTIDDNMQTLTKTFTDRSQKIQTQMSAVSSNDQTVTNTLKTALSNITQLEQSINQQMSSAS